MRTTSKGGRRGNSRYESSEDDPERESSNSMQDGPVLDASSGSGPVSLLEVQADSSLQKSPPMIVALSMSHLRDNKQARS